MPRSESDVDPDALRPSPLILASHDERLPAHRASKKLQKRRRDGPYSPNMELPERLKDHGDEGEREEDVLHPQGGGRYMNMNQSIFGLIAAAGSRVDFNDRFEGQSSDEDEDGDGHMAMTELRSLPRRQDISSGSLAQTTVLQKASSAAGSTGSGHRRKGSAGSRILRSVPVLSKLSSKSKSKSGRDKSFGDQIQEEAEDEESISAAAEPIPTLEVSHAERLPVMSRMLEGRAQMAARPSFDLDRATAEQAREGDLGETSPTELAKKLMEIFEFDEAEEVIQEYPCWLLQHVLLQGYMYITTKHIAFYAYLPKRAHELAKSGYLSKSGKRNPKYHRYWFRLKGDVLSYYRDSQNLYFPSGQIDLRYGISASVTDKDKEGIHFSLTTHHRTYHFKADSAPSAKEWVKSLQRVIFRSHNDGDSVKISLPIENVIDIEETHMLEFADTCKVRVIDNDETYAIDEYFFSFFSFGKEALNVLRILIEGSTSQTPGDDRQLSAQQSDAKGSSNELSSEKTSLSESRERQQNLPKIRTGKLNEGVRATLSPLSPTHPSHSSPSPRASGDFTRSSFDALRPFGRRSMELSQLQEPVRRSFSESRRSPSRNRLGNTTDTLHKHGSSDSYVQSMEEPSQPSMSAMGASGSEDPSASQILRGSDVFHSPTVRRSASDSRSPKIEGSSGRPSTTRHPVSGLSKYSARHAATTGHVADPAVGEKNSEGMPVTPTMNNFSRMTGYPFQKANAFVGYTRRMSTLLATESMGYVEKVSGMWKGGKKHYEEPPSELRTDDDEDNDVDSEDRITSNNRFRAHFTLPDGETLQAAYFGYIIRVLPLYGKIYISDRHFCFRSLLPGTRTKLILPLKDIETADKEKGFRFGYSGLVVVIRGHEELFFEFGKADVRDDCAITLIQNLEATRYLRESSIIGSEEIRVAQAAVAERDALQEARTEEFPAHEVLLPRQTSGLVEAPTILFDDPKASMLNFKPDHALRITCLTVGSRGDVQPYIALCKGLQREGHKTRIATHAEFRPWIESHGIEFALVDGDPSELMRLCIENGTFTWSFLKEANAKMRTWIEELLSSAWTACQGSDLIIESPSAMAGIHIAEALNVPYFRAFGMPWTRTRSYPHAFIVPGQKMGGAYNYVTYVMFDNVFWKATAHQINRWRNNTLGLPNTNLEKMQINKVPFLYNFSPFVVPPPLDFSDWIRVTGYWFLDEGDTSNWQPPQELVDFIEKARRDEKKLVYVGFGSIIVPDPAKMTQEVIDAVLKADVRCILSKGWSDRILTAKEKEKAESEDGSIIKEKEKKAAAEPTLPPEIFLVKSVPHDWLFTQIDAAAHHGGSGSTGASLRAGIPTIVRPFFGDQYFFGNRVEELGVGICLKRWGAISFGRALWEATHSERMIVKARVLGEQIRKENGIDTAIQAIYRDLEYATSLIKAKTGKNTLRRNSIAAAAAARVAGSGSGSNSQLPADDADEDVYDEDEEEESWTFVGGDADVVDEFAHDPAFLQRAAVAAAQVGGDVRRTAGAGAGLGMGGRILGGPKRAGVS